MIEIQGKRHNPGSDDAIEAGCKCPQSGANNYGASRVDGFFVLAPDCEYHKELVERMFRWVKDDE